MKNQNVLFVMAMVIALSSCKNLEKILPANEGTWVATSASLRVFEEGEPATYETTTFEEDESIMKFSKDGTGEIIQYGEIVPFTWTADKDMEQITLEVDGLITKFDVLECTKKTMTLFFTWEEEDAGIKTSLESTLHFEKAS